MSVTLEAITTFNSVMLTMNLCFNLYAEYSVNQVFYELHLASYMQALDRHLT